MFVNAFSQLPLCNCKYTGLSMDVQTVYSFFKRWETQGQEWNTARRSINYVLTDLTQVYEHTYLVPTDKPAKERFSF